MPFRYAAAIKNIDEVTSLALFMWMLLSNTLDRNQREPCGSPTLPVIR